MFEFLGKLFKFGATGLLGMGIDFGTTWLCKEKAHWNKYVSNSLGFSLAVMSNYTFNRIWTFQSSNPNWLGEFLRYLLISLVGLLINNTVIYFFHGRKDRNFYVAKLLAVALVFVWNFTANFLFTFKH